MACFSRETHYRYGDHDCNFATSFNFSTQVDHAMGPRLPFSTLNLPNFKIITDGRSVDVLSAEFI